MKILIAVVLVLFIGSGNCDEEPQIFECYTCSSKTDVKCITNLSALTPTSCVEDTGLCFTNIDPSTGDISRGCQTKDMACEGDNCATCQHHLCNIHTICKKCDSSLDPECAQTDASKNTFNAVCPEGQTKCLSKVKDNKHTERRCATADDEKSCTDNCQICDTPNCNVGIFPAKRLHCYQCNSTDSKCGDVTTNSGSIESRPCLLYADNETCYTFGTSATSMTRGCVSDSDTAVNKCQTTESDKRCAVCATDNCNNLLYETNQSIKCIQCDSSDSACHLEHDASEAKDCQNKLLYYQEAGCYWETTADNQVQRGCIYDRTTEQGACDASKNCSTCDAANGCNNADVNVNFSCIRCRSDTESKCYNPSDGKLTGAECRNNVTSETVGCFTGTWNDVVIRGCMVDADPRQKIVCEDPHDSQCTMCKEKDCNDAKEGAASLRVASGLLAVLAFGLWRLR